MKTVNPGANTEEWKAAGDLLLAAKSRIEKQGWQQGAIKPTSRECVATALEHAFQKDRFSIVEFNYAREALSRTLKIEREPRKLEDDPLDVPYWGRLLMEWNDAPGRTKDEVLETFRNAAALAAQLSRSQSRN